METCVLPSPPNNTVKQEMEQGHEGQTGHQQDTYIIIPTAAINIRKSSTTTLSDLIPAAAEALRTRQHLQRTTSDNNHTPFADSSSSLSSSSSSLCNQRPTTTNATPFARALTKVKLQVQTKRLKERYLSHEWIRLALGLPVDLSRINLHHCYYSREQLDGICSSTKTTTAAEFQKAEMNISGTHYFSPPPSPASSLLLDTPFTTSPITPSSSRTSEIATWYEWKIDRSKFSVDEVQIKVDRLRTTKLRDKLAPS